MYRHSIFFHVPLLYFDDLLAVGFCRIKTKNLVLLRLETNDHSEEARQLISNLPGAVSSGEQSPRGKKMRCYHFHYGIYDLV